jgi:hypothetical protein
MSDTLTHLRDMAQIAALLKAVFSALRPGGRFIATFRDYTRLPTGPDRFSPCAAIRIGSTPAFSRRRSATSSFTMSSTNARPTPGR